MPLIKNEHAYNQIKYVFSMWLSLLEVGGGAGRQNKPTECSSFFALRY